MSEKFAGIFFLSKGEDFVPKPSIKLYISSLNFNLILSTKLHKNK